MTPLQDRLYAREGYFSRRNPDRLVWGLGYARPGRHEIRLLTNASGTKPLWFTSYDGACRFCQRSQLGLPKPIPWPKRENNAPRPAIQTAPPA